MNEVTIFRNKEFGKIRTILIDGEIWFVAKDIALSLGYKNTNQAVITNVDDDDRRASTIMTPSGTQGMVVINESGMYSMILRSQLDSSKRFKRWVTSEVLPSIRKTGSYSIKQDSYMIEDPKERAKRWIEEYEEKQRLKERVEILEPKGQYFDGLVDAKLLTTFRDCAKEFNMKQKAFNNWLREHGYIYNDRHNIIKPYQQYVKSGLFQMKDFKSPYGYSNVQTYITVKGKETFRLLMQMPNEMLMSEVTV